MSGSRARHFRPDRVAALIEVSTRSGVEDHSQGIWRLMIYELWHREFVDGAVGPCYLLATRANPPPLGT